MATFSDENKMKGFKTGTEAFSTEVKSQHGKTEHSPLSQKDVTAIEKVGLGFKESEISVKTDYGYEIKSEDRAYSGESHSFTETFTSSSKRGKRDTKDPFIYHDYGDREGKRTHTDKDAGVHDKMAYRQRETQAGGGAKIDFKYKKDGTLAGKIVLNKEKDRTDNKGFTKRTIQFAEKSAALFDTVKPENEDSASSVIDTKLEHMMFRSARTHRRKAGRYKQIRAETAREIKQLEREIKQESSSRKKQDSRFTDRQVKFKDDYENFSDLIESKFHSKEKEARYQALFIEDKKVGTIDRTPVTKGKVESLFAENEKDEKTLPSRTASKSDVESMFLPDTKSEKNELAINSQTSEVGASKSTKEDHSRQAREKSSSKDIESKFEPRNMSKEERLEQSKAQKKSADKSKNKEVRKAASRAAVSKFLESKKALQNQMGDMSGQVSGDLLQDGSAGMLNVATNTIKQLMVEAAKKVIVAVASFFAGIFTTLIIPVCVCCLVIVIIMGAITAISSGLSTDIGASYDLDVNGDGYAYTSISEDEIDLIIESLIENYDDITYTQIQTLRYSLSKVGCPYDQNYHANMNVDIFDCSSLAYRSYLSAGVDVSHHKIFTAAEICRGMMGAGNTVSGEMKPGDLIFYGGIDNGRYMGIYHVAIYVGRVNGVDKMVEARGTNYGVVYCDVRTNNVVNISRPS